jgi:hypothetical protein
MRTHTHVTVYPLVLLCTSKYPNRYVVSRLLMFHAHQYIHSHKHVYIHTRDRDVCAPHAYHGEQTIRHIASNVHMASTVESTIRLTNDHVQAKGAAKSRKSVTNHTEIPTIIDPVAPR